ncbi:MAG: DNA-processing protein DprA [bacterium]|nr:DNA-processing protein DprA [bacterium]
MYTITGERIPPLLAELPDAPKRLFVRGELPQDEKLRYLTVVGARRHSAYGREVCETLIAGLAGYPVVIVSGLALGIDGIAHRAALASGLTTIAFPGSGLSEQVLYPSTHRALAREILSQGGALMSEFDPDFRPTAWSFHQRNRIMAGISHATLAIEAEERSGTLITAKLALEYNRDVFAVPGPIFSPTAGGPNLLLRLGATPIRHSRDILEALGLSAAPGAAEKYTDTSNCSAHELRILEILKTPIERDELIRALGTSVSETNTLIAALELKGLVVEKLGALYRVK